MKSAALVQLHNLLGVASDAEAVRLAAVLSRIALHRRNADGFRRALLAAPADRAVDQAGPLAADLITTVYWGDRLADLARREEACAAALEPLAQDIRQSLARAHGRQSVAGKIAERERAQERRLAEARAEANVYRPGGGRGQSGSPVSESDGSPGIA